MFYVPCIVMEHLSIMCLVLIQVMVFVISYIYFIINCFLLLFTYLNCQATKRLLYGNQQTCNEALLNIQETFPEFYTYLTNNWLMMADMFMGYRRKGLLHIDNHANNRLEWYHRTLKDVGLTSRMSPGNLINKIIKVNRVQLEKSKHADFDQRLKINTKLPECLKFYAHTISSFILQHMVEQYNLSQKEGYSLQEENNCLQVRYNDCLFPLHNWTCQCDNATGYGVPCSHAFFAIREKNMNLSDLDLIHKRWFVPTHQMVNVNQGDNLSNSCMTFSIQPVALCNSTVKERYNTALSHLQPLASILSEFTPSKFDLAIKWLESVCQQCISGEWELQVQQHHSEDDVISENNFETNVEIFPECSSATLECVLPVSPQVSLQTNSVATSNIYPTITCETLHVERLQTNVEIFPESSLSATLECVLPVSPQISIQTNSETTSKNFPTITCETLPVEKRYTTRILEDIDIVLRKPQRFPPGRPAVKKQRLFYNVTKPLEKLGVYEKDFIRLT
ncbi:uncharacterized protein LOC124812322 [Hydra vulgaris]|uniref:uncharacterized protein LOC124812322 n=1 Tax=Hydra vulgaris TaxID=6087 RepID=UPI001F5F968D|nr:uncharacterized protein LOC124812322 [Hydra vulgaris]